MSYLINCGGANSTDLPEILFGYRALLEWVSADQLALVNKTIDYSKNTPVGFQPTLVSGTNIKTVNSTSLVGSGNVAVQPTLVSGTNIKTVNGVTLLGSGDMSVGTSYATLVKFEAVSY